jgi:hypothetical protein
MHFMRTPHPRFVALVLALACSASELTAQRLGPAPKRPKALAIADTNDARAYFNYAVSVLEQEPGQAADAFYWAARLDPLNGEAPYGRAIASVMRSRPLYRQYMTGGRRTMQSKELRQIDSLLFRAHTIDPLLYRRFDSRMVTHWYKQTILESAPPLQRPSENEVNHFLDVEFRQAGTDMQAWMAYGNGDFDTALRLYAEAMKGERKKAWYRIERGRIFGRRANADSAIAEFQAALTELRARDAKELVTLYNSKAVIEHSIALLLEQKNDNEGAREAYGRALQEYLAYHPAHVKLGLLALSLKNTATALSELDLATQIAPQERYVQYMNAAVLVNTGRLAATVR